MTAISGSAAAVTGAASGIGRALAHELALRGCDLAIADRDEAGLQAAAAEIAKVSPRKVTVHRLDVSEPGQIAAFAEAAGVAHPGLNIVVNNAGVALLGEFCEIEQAQMEWLFNINFWGVVHGTRAFLPLLSRQREAHIVNISSIFGAASPPTSRATRAPAPASPTMPAAPNRSSVSTRWPGPRRPRPRSASSPASRKTSHAS